MTLKGQAGGQKFRPKKLKYKLYYGGNDAQDAQAAANLALKAEADNAIKEARTAALFKAVITSETPFENYNEQIAKELLDTGIDPNSRNENQVTLLGFAVDRLKTNMVKILLEYNADPNLNCTPGPNDSGPSLPPLHMLTMNLTHLEPYDPNNNAVHALFENEAHWTQMVKNQNIQAQKDILVLLLKNGANINKLNSDNDAPIHLAIETENKHLLQKLLDNGANPDILNFNGKSPFILASDSLHESDLAVATLVVENNPIPPSLMERGANALDMVNILRIHLAKRERNKVLTTQLAPPTNKDIIPTNELPKGKRIITKSNDYPLISDVIGNINSYYGGNSKKTKKPYYYRKSKKNKKLVTKKQKGGLIYVHDRQDGAGYGFIISLHKLLTNQEYSNIISYKFDNDGNILIVLKDKFLVAKEVCPRANWGDFSSCARQFCNYGFKTVSRKKIQRIGENELVFSNPKVKSIDDILTLERKISTKCRKSPTIDDGDREANVLAQLNNTSPQSTDMDNNEAANVLASIANISDENTEDLDRRTSYLQNLNTNNEHSLKIALLIESLKNHVIDENQTNQIKQKQNELWQSLKEIPMEDEQRRGVLYKYMFEYLKRTIPQAKLNEGAKIAQSIFESIKRAQIHNRHTKPLTESEQKQADEEMNAAISRESQLGQNEDTNMEDVQSAPTPHELERRREARRIAADPSIDIREVYRREQLAQDEDTNMEDVQSPNTQLEEPWWKKGGITDKALVRLHSEPVDGHMIEVWMPFLSTWKLGRAVRKKGRNWVVLKRPLNSPSSAVAETVRQIVTQVDYIDGTSVDELLHRGDWKKRQNPWMKDSEDYLLNLGSDNPKYWRYAKSNSRSQSGGVIYVDDENDKMRFECPLSLDIMNEPVIAEDGYSYEKEEIVNWIKLSEDKGNPITSPITGDNMGKTLIPNTVLKDIIKNSVFDRQHTNQESSQIEDENKNKGIVIQYKDSKYGFIHTFDGIDNLFFHSSQLDNQIIVGDIVSFVIKEFKGKPTATNIKLIEPAWNRKTGVIVKYNNAKQYGFIEADINGMPHIFVHISEINQLVSVGDKVSFIIGKNMAGKAVAKKVKIINDKIYDEIGVEEEKKEDSEIPQLEQRLLMELIFERDRIMREREKVNSMIKSRK